MLVDKDRIYSSNISKCNNGNDEIENRPLFCINYVKQNASTVLKLAFIGGKVTWSSSCITSGFPSENA